MNIWWMHDYIVQAKSEHKEGSTQRRIVLNLLSILILIGVTVIVMVPGVTKADVITASKDTLRTGWYPNETKLTPDLVSGDQFGTIFKTQVAGQIYAQPLIANNVLFVATEANNIYGLDPSTGKKIWSRNVGIPFNPQDINCGNILPSIGITGTPVIDEETNSAYFVAKTYIKGHSGPTSWNMHSVNIKTGKERSGFPVLIQGRADNEHTHPFNATLELQRPGLLLMNGVVYAAFGGHCDTAPYEGWVVGVSTQGQLKALWSDEAGVKLSDPLGPGAGIWMSGSGLVSDSKGTLLLSTGNGAAPAPNTPGLSGTPGALGQCVVRLNVQKDGTLKASDFFAPYDADQLNETEADLGSGAPMELPPHYFGTAGHPRIVLEVTKQGYIYLLDADNLGGRGQGKNHGDAVVNRLRMDGGMWGRPGVWPGDGGYVYMMSANRGEGSGSLFAYRYGLDQTGKPGLELAGTAPGAFGFGSTSPVVTSNGIKSGSALVWVIWTSGPDGKDAQLRAYDPLPVKGLLNLRYSFPIGTASKFNPPAVDNNRIYVGNRDGSVIGLGIKGSQPAVLKGQNIDLGMVAYGKSATGVLTLTASQATTISNVSLDNDLFSLGTSTPLLPAKLKLGQSIQIPITLMPGASANLIAANVSITTTQGIVQFGVTGMGQELKGSLQLSVDSISFGGTFLDAGPISTVLTITNPTATAVTFMSETLPGGPFKIRGLPAVQSSLPPGASIEVSVFVNPQAVGYIEGMLKIETNTGVLNLPLSVAVSS